MELVEQVWDMMDRLPCHFLGFDETTTVDSILASMQQAVDAYGVEHVIIDNLQFMLNGRASRDEMFHHQDYALRKLRTFATEQDIHVSLIVHPRKEALGQALSIASIFGTAKATQEADNVYLLQEEVVADPSNFGPGAPSTRQVFLECRKNRYDGVIGRVRLEFIDVCLKYQERDGAIFTLSGTR